MMAEALAPPTLSMAVLLTLLLCLGASVAVYAVLVRRETTRRGWVALSDWAKSAGLGVTHNPTALPAAAEIFSQFHPKVRLLFSGRRTHLLQFTTDALPAAGGEATQWHVLLRELATAQERKWDPTGLRPATQTLSLLDQFSLSSFPSLSAGQRFVVFGTRPAPAKALAESSAAALTPPDVGIVLHGSVLALDFSSRPFDTIEFGRMLAVADQLEQHIPPPPGLAAAEEENGSQPIPSL